MIFLTNYGLFLAKTATVVIAIAAVLILIFALKAKAKSMAEMGSLNIKKLNEKYEDMADTVRDLTQTKTEKKAARKALKKHKTEEATSRKRIFVLRFDGDIKASEIDSLRETITTILLSATSEDQVVLCLESGGGIVPNYGFAASQLQRLRDAKLHLTVAIDTIAASGGYMMACVANQIIAAPFAIIGSIGVVAQLPNFHRLLQKNNIDFEQITAGQYKRTLTLFGKNTEEGREKLQSEIDETHELFKSFVATHRPTVNVNAIATGEHWYASQCIEKNLVDHLQTSDDYLLTKKDSHDIYEIEFKIKQSLANRLNVFARSVMRNMVRS